MDITDRIWEKVSIERGRWPYEQVVLTTIIGELTMQGLDRAYDVRERHRDYWREQSYAWTPLDDARIFEAVEWCEAVVADGNTREPRHVFRAYPNETPTYDVSTEMEMEVCSQFWHRDRLEQASLDGFKADMQAPPLEDPEATDDESIEFRAIQEGDTKEFPIVVD